MTTVGQLSARVKNILDELIIVVDSMRNSHANMNKPSAGVVANESQIDSLKKQADTANRQFEEAQHKFQLSGGKSRRQTLQEFVILFFFVAYAAFTVSLILYGRAVGVSTAKIFGGMAFALLMISGIIIRYA